MSITELKDRFRKLGCGVRWNHGVVHIIKYVPVNIVDIDKDSIFYLNTNHMNKKQQMKIKDLCQKYYDERNGR